MIQFRILLFLFTTLSINTAFASNDLSRISCGKNKASGIRYIENQEYQTLYIGFTNLTSGRVNELGKYESTEVISIIDEALSINLKFSTEDEKNESRELVSLVNTSRFLCVAQVFKSFREFKHIVVSTGHSLQSAISDLESKIGR